VDLTRDEAGKSLKREFRDAFEYSDCWVDDARLVVLNAVDAAKRGATIETRTEMVRAERRDKNWVVTLRDESGMLKEISARVLVNAAGPWVAELLTDRIGLPVDAPVRLVKGSHIIVPRLFTHDRAYIFQNADGRIVFAIPYEGDFTLIGTTDLDYDGDPGEPRATEAEIDYLCSAAGEYFEKEPRPSDVVRSYSGVRPLYDDGASEAQAATRDYVLKVEDQNGAAPILNIYGGKITTYRRLAEAALEKLAPYLKSIGRSWTAGAQLPGGDFPVDGFKAEVSGLQAACPSCRPEHARRLVRAYGTSARKIVEGVRTPADWGETFGADLTEREVRYLTENEWARTADDVLWRRSKLGLHVSESDAVRLDEWMRGISLAVAESAAMAGAAQ
jgi:glycerol-3-phosphate dehydrogenase